MANGEGPISSKLRARIENMSEEDGAALLALQEIMGGLPPLEQAQEAPFFEPQLEFEPSQLNPAALKALQTQTLGEFFTALSDISQGRPARPIGAAAQRATSFELDRRRRNLQAKNSIRIAESNFRNQILARGISSDRQFRRSLAQAFIQNQTRLGERRDAAETAAAVALAEREFLNKGPSKDPDADAVKILEEVGATKPTPAQVGQVKAVLGGVRSTSTIQAERSREERRQRDALSGARTKAEAFFRANGRQPLPAGLVGPTAAGLVREALGASPDSNAPVPPHMLSEIEGILSGGGPSGRVATRAVLPASFKDMLDTFEAEARSGSPPDLASMQTTAEGILERPPTPSEALQSVLAVRRGTAARLLDEKNTKARQGIAVSAINLEQKLLNRLNDIQLAGELAGKLGLVDKASIKDPEFQKFIQMTPKQLERERAATQDQLDKLYERIPLLQSVGTQPAVREEATAPAATDQEETDEEERAIGVMEAAVQIALDTIDDITDEELQAMFDFALANPDASPQEIVDNVFGGDLGGQ